MRSVLVVRLSAMGDVAMTAPVVGALRSSYPDLRIIVLTQPFLKPFFREVEGVEFVPFDKKGRHKGFGGIFLLWRDIRKEFDIDAVADLHDVLRSKILRTLFLLCGKRVAVIRKGRCEKAALTRRKCKKMVRLHSTFDRYADVFRRLGFSVSAPVSMPRKIRTVPDEILNITGGKYGRWIGIAPFAQHKGKIYPLDRMESVVMALSRMPGIKLFIFGGGDKEKAVAEGWEAKYEGTVSVIGKIKLDRELDLISNLDCVVSMDSAAMHMASLEGIPVVSVWGATHPYAGFVGLGQSECNAVQTDMDCRPCSVYGNKPCFKGDYPCMDSITPGAVAAAVLRVLDRNEK